MRPRLYGIPSSIGGLCKPMQMSVAGEKIVVADRYSVRVYGPNTAPPPSLPTRRRMTRH
jgi:hypothetical protein